MTNATLTRATPSRQADGNHCNPFCTEDKHCDCGPVLTCTEVVKKYDVQSMAIPARQLRRLKLLCAIEEFNRGEPGSVIGLNLSA